MPTIDEIARLARVSPATVSKVLNNRPYVSQATRARVEQVIAETGFVPSQRARGLSARRSFILGLLIPYSADQFFADPHLLEIMRGIEAEANRHGYHLLFSTARAPLEAASSFSHLLRSDMIDGAILVETLDVQPFAELLRQRPTPSVVIGYAPPDLAPAVHADDFGGALAATRHLLGLGHCRLAVISSVSRPYALDERLRGIRAGLAETELALDSDLLVSGDFSLASGEMAAGTVLDRPDPPTAIFALNDRMAAGAMRAASARGLRIPEDLSVVGFDDIALASLLSPALTTVRQPGYCLGEVAAATLISLLGARVHTSPGRSEPIVPSHTDEGRTPLGGQVPASPAVIATELIVRGSSGPPRALERG